MRITTQRMVQESIRQMQASRERLVELQERAASGKQVQRLSDDPAIAVAGLNLRSSLAASEAFQRSAEEAAAWMGSTDAAVGQMLELATRASQLALSGLSDTLGSEQRQALAEEMEALIDSAVTTANSSYGGNYLFAGFQIRTLPFTRASGPPETVAYSGDTGIMRRDIGMTQSIPVNLNGQTAFGPLFSALIEARQALEADDTTALATAHQNLATSVGVVTDQRALLGGRLRELNQASERMEKVTTELKTLLSQVEDADLAEAISLLRGQETAYQAVIETSGRILSTPSLFEVLGG